MFFISDSSETSSEEENKQTLRLKRKAIRHKSEVFSLPDDIFVKYFGLNKDAFKYVVEEMDPYMKDAIRSTFIPNTLKLAATLLFLTQGSYQSDVGNDFNLGLSQPAVSTIMEETLDVLENTIYPLFIKFDRNAEEESDTKLEFLKRTGFPGVIGCIDGTHIKILAPSKDIQNLYKNSEGFFSLNTLIICDHKMRIIYMDARNPGSYEASEIWNSSPAKEVLQKRYDTGERNFWLLGDADFPIEHYLLTPYPLSVSRSDEANYNDKHKRAINIVEETVGVLKNRFRCLLGPRPLHYKPAKATKIANVCAALHNICIKYNPETATEIAILDKYENNVDIFENSQIIDASEIQEQIKSSFSR